MNKKHYKLNKRNSKILHDTLVSLGALKGASSALSEMRINEIQVHLLDEGGDGVILCLEYDESSGELNKTFSCVDEFYDDTVEVELEDVVEDEDEAEDEDEDEDNTETEAMDCSNNNYSFIGGDDIIEYIDIVC